LQICVFNAFKAILEQKKSVFWRRALGFFWRRFSLTPEKV